MQGQLTRTQSAALGFVLLDIARGFKPPIAYHTTSSDVDDKAISSLSQFCFKVAILIETCEYEG